MPSCSVNANSTTTNLPKEPSIYSALSGIVTTFVCLLVWLPSLQGAQGKVGLLVSERMINCPMQAVPKLHEALVEDIAWAVENEVSVSFSST